MLRAVFASIAPRGLVNPVVERIWLSETIRAGSGVEWRLPTGRAELLFNLGPDEFQVLGRDGVPRRYSGAVVAGPSARPFALDVAQQGRVLGVVFRPGAARAVLGVPMHEIAGQHVSLSDLWGGVASSLQERLLRSAGAEARLAEAERILAGRLETSSGASHPLVGSAMVELSRNLTRESGHVADRLGFTRRRVEQVFRADVGMAPDVFRRLARFRATLCLIDRAASVGWAGFALERGYCDQAHLIREFRAHAAVSPATYVRLRGPAINHVPAPTC